MENEPPEILQEKRQKRISRFQSSDMEDDLIQIAKRLKNAIQADWVSVILINDDRTELDLLTCCGNSSNRNPIPNVEDVLTLEISSKIKKPDIQQQFQRAVNNFSHLFSHAVSIDQSEFLGLIGPIIVDEQVVGILTAARNSRGDPFDLEDWQFLDIINSQISLIFQNQLLTHLERNAREQAETLREIALALNSSLDLQTVLEMILDQIDRVVGYDSASIILASNNNIFQIVAYRKHQITKQSIFEGNISDYSHIQQVFEKRNAVVIKNTDKAGNRRLNLPGSSLINCWLGVPLIGKDEVIGLISLDKNQEDFYSKESAELATVYANQAAIAIENARYYSYVQSQLDQLDALRETVADISTELQLPKLLESILKRATILLNAKGGDLGLYNEHEDVIDIVASYQMEWDSVGVRLVRGEGAMGAALLAKKPIIIEDYARWQYASVQYPKETYHSVIAVPFMIGDRVIGTIAIMADDPKRIFSKGDEYLLSLFAQQAAIAVENARLYQDAHAAAERRAILHQASQQIVGIGFEQEGVYKAIHDAAAQLMPVEAFVITYYDEATDMIQSSYLIDRNVREYSDPIPKDEGISGIIMREGKTILINDLSNDPIREQASHFGEGESVRSILAVPMRMRDKVVGMISAQSYQPYNYSSEDTYLLEMLASYAGIALENARLFQHIQQLATIDSVTEISNRRHLFDLGYLEFVRANRFSRALSVIMVDIDNFKRVNDQYGHAAGDQVLAKLAKLLRTEVREVDIVGRYGGEEFTVILPETTVRHATEIAERLRRKINQTFAPDLKDTPHITVSIGVAEYIAELPNFESLVELADKALYAAKRAGRDRIEAYSPASA